MKKLKRGDFVYHKSLGRGIVSTPDKLSNGKQSIFFEGRCLTKDVDRSEVFVRGDRIIIKRPGKTSRWNDDRNSKFYEFMPHNPSCETEYTYSNDYYSGVQYCKDVKHIKQKPSVFFPGEKQLLLDTVEDTVINHPITTKEVIKTVKIAGDASDVGWNMTNLMTRVMTGEFETAVQKPDEVKEQLLKRIEILELQARIKELEA